MTAILDVCEALAALLEPDLPPVEPGGDPVPPPTARVVLDTEPLIWEKEHLYVYPLRVEETPIETASSRRQEFDINAVYVTDNEGEEAQLKRDPALAQLLDGKRGQYMGAVRTNQATHLWYRLRAITDDTRPRTLDKRSAAVRVNGARIVGGN